MKINNLGGDIQIGLAAGIADGGNIRTHLITPLKTQNDISVLQ